MDHFAERVLTDELAEAKMLLDRALVILDCHEEDEAAYSVCLAIERLIGAPSMIEQWYLLTGRNYDRPPRNSSGV